MCWLLLLLLLALYGLWGSDAPWFICCFRLCINCSFVYLTFFFTSFIILPSCPMWAWGNPLYSFTLPPCTSCRLQSNSSTVTLHGGPVVLRPVRATPCFLDRPFCERSILCFTHVSFFLFFPQLTFSDVCKPTFSKLFHMTWLYSKKKRCYSDFVKVPPNKN